MREALILCPLEHEARVLRACLAGRAVRVCGPGRAAETCVRGLGEDQPGLLILAGLCGGLREGSRVPRITRVISTRGQVWRVPVTLALAPKREAGAGDSGAGVPGTAQGFGARSLHEGGGAHDGATLIGVDEIVRTARAKRALGERFGADVCDMEAHHFAYACVDVGIRWAVVRGVSDGPDEDVASGLDGLVDARGRTRVGAAVRRCVLRPWEVGGLLRLRRQSVAALKEVAGAVERLLESEDRDVSRAAG